MIKHVIIWTLKSHLSDEEKLKIKKEAKCALEALNGNIEGLLELKIICDLLDSSSGELMLDSTLEGPEALSYYRDHPLHQAAADTFIRPYTETRLCVDYET